MALSNLLKVFALLALLTLDVKAASSEPARRLRIEPSDNNLELPAARELAGKNSIKWMKIIKDNIKNQPLIDKAYENAKKIKYYAEKAKGK
ncbi:uncharacterized protein KRP23_11933 [Phytophthora ramorum]|uniref:uncharacterized protein n=1 Tax=Phytophthora ramorum TaxID=164328 RepID=UPI0030A33436|nr:hypothetical protein KRP23_11927 [Phytophthora ramorum]KAH7465951.1 hypothetical protein KRP23_11928 [Phytophthora ramorum]KAH7465952.1 hypothetical protein KRP23_11929 [Phytophthora ramorum]KAH7465953.1 hypothetical protein KRP23_11930 [Phytophthora ramorum]KAH7465954.1 hypothetical protein KRP23_11931 [Phytophthora ramorum]